MKNKLKEDVCEDNPITAAVYREGECNGEIKGINKASEKYEKKISALKEEFLKVQQDAEKEIVSYRNLLDECENVIEELENKLNRTQEENACLLRVLLLERKLTRIPVVEETEEEDVASKQTVEDEHGETAEQLYNEGWRYEMGDGVPKDIQRAKELYRKAAFKGNQTAKSRLNYLINMG